MTQPCTPSRLAFAKMNDRNVVQHVLKATAQTERHLHRFWKSSSLFYEQNREFIIFRGAAANCFSEKFCCAKFWFCSCRALHGASKTLSMSSWRYADDELQTFFIDVFISNITIRNNYFSWYGKLMPFLYNVGTICWEVLATFAGLQTLETKRDIITLI